MNLIIGLIISAICVFGIFAAIGGSLVALIQPGEFGIIFGAAIGAYVIANPNFVIKMSLRDLKLLFSRPKINKAFFTDLLVLLFQILKLMKTQGVNVLEKDIEAPKESEIFKKYQTILSNHTLVEFICDYLRILTMGVTEVSCIEDMMNIEMETEEKENENNESALITMADGLPALGIVAAVLGVIKTMSHIDAPPAELGKLIAGALVGTFLGVFLSYAIVGPMSSYINKVNKENSHYMVCVKAALVAFMQGQSPVIAIEIARKSIPERLRPDFSSIENSLFS